MQDNKITFKGLTVWIICAVFFLYEFLLRTVIGTFQHPIMYELDLTTFRYSILSSTTYLIVYGLMQVPVGIIVDYYGLKKSLFFSAIVCSFATLGFAFTHDFYYAIFFRMLTGFGSSFGFICLLVAVYDWLPNSRIGLFIGISQFIGTLGPMLAAGPLDSLSNASSVSWRHVFIYLAIIGIFLSILIIIFVRNNHNKSGNYTILYKSMPILTSLKKLFQSIQPIAIAVLCSIIYFSIEYLSENEGKSFLVEKNISENIASYMITIAWLGYAIGCPVLGFLSDYIQKRKPILVFCSFLAALSMIFVTFNFNSYILQISFFFMGVGASGISLGYALMAEQFKKHFVAIGLGFNNAMITVVSAINAPVVGYLLNIHGSEKFNIADYQFAFSFLIGFIFLSIFISIFLIKESFCKSQATFTILKRN